MYSVFETQHGKREALALMIHLFKSCNDPLSAEKLEALINADGHYHRTPLLFSGRRVNEEEREKFNFRNLIVHTADELEESKQEDLVTLFAGPNRRGWRFESHQLQKHSRSHDESLQQ